MDSKASINVILSCGILSLSKRNIVTHCNVGNVDSEVSLNVIL